MRRTILGSANKVPSLTYTMKIDHSDEIKSPDSAGEPPYAKSGAEDAPPASYGTVVERNGGSQLIEWWGLGHAPWKMVFTPSMTAGTRLRNLQL